MGNNLNGTVSQSIADKLNFSELSLTKTLQFSLIFIGLIQSLTFSYKTIKNVKESILPPQSFLNLNGKKRKWAFILNSTSDYGYVVATYLAEKNYNLILSSFEAERLDEVKATIFMKFPEISLEVYYLYKTDMKNFEEKFHFRDFLKKFDVEVFILNDCLIQREEGPNFLDFGYEDLQYELSKKFLLKTFLFKIILENCQKTENHVKKPIIFNINDINSNQIEVLRYKGFEEFLKNSITEKYGCKFELKIFNVYNDQKASFFNDNEVYKQNVIKQLFGI